MIGMLLAQIGLLLALLVITNVLCCGKGALVNSKFNWVLTNDKGDIKVPGTTREVHVDLLNAGILKENPLYRYQELNSSWVTKLDWHYETIPFRLDDVDLSLPLVLQLMGVDTLSTIYFNGQELGSTKNEFKSYSFLVDTSNIKSDNNVIRISITNPLDYTKLKALKYPYEVPETVNWNIWAEPTSRNFVRKAGSDFGWDWGPAFLPLGITGDVLLKQCKFGCLDQIIVNQDLSADLKSAHITVGVSLLRAPAHATQSTYSVYVNSELVLEKTVDLVHGTRCGDDLTFVTIGAFTLDHVKLWWPRSYGPQHLYDIEVKQMDSSETMHKKFGVRRVELVEEAVATADNVDLYTVNPTTFYFKVNNVRIFMKGSNFIPIDVFNNARVTADDMEYVMRAAITANMNMIRVWGGGIYQPDYFYDLADSLGMLIWNEFTFACSLYPTDTGFLQDVKEEVLQQVARLNTHPSIIVFGGNNENEVALQWFSASVTNRDLYVADYTKLYADTIYPAIKLIEPSSMRVWIDSSPSNGLISTEPYAKRWGSASTAAAGDVHFYDYDCNCESYKSFPAARFVSEFGFQVMPSFVTYEKYIDEADYNPNSELLLYRQRHENGNIQMDRQISLHFTQPLNCGGASTDKHYFDSYLYLTQIQQARCYETAVNWWRSQQSEAAQTMGILYWQLNDIWPGPSWSSIEYGGRFKPLQYTVRRAFNNLVISSNVDLESQFVSFNVVNDVQQALKVQVTLTLQAWSSASIHDVVYSAEYVVGPASSTSVWTTTVSDILAKSTSCTPETCYVKATVEDVNHEVHTFPYYTFLQTMAMTELEANPKFILGNFKEVDENNYQFTLSSSNAAPFTLLELKNAEGTEGSNGVFGNIYAGWFSDNTFLAEAAVEYTLTYTTAQRGLSLDLFRSLLTVRALQHCYVCN
jgi:beta-mannosidase